MPLSDIDWTKDPRDPGWLLRAWGTAVANVLLEQLGSRPLDSRRFVTAAERTGRDQFVQAATGSGALTDPPTLQVPARFTDLYGVVLSDCSDLRASAAVLFVTPDNKSDSDAALAFAVRAAGMMSGGSGVVIVDALPGPANWATHLHSLTGVYPIARRPRGGESPILVVQPEVRDGTERFAVWHYGVAPGFPLPTVSVPVRESAPMKLDLEATYLEACKQTRPSS